MEIKRIGAETPLNRDSLTSRFGCPWRCKTLAHNPLSAHFRGSLHRTNLRAGYNCRSR